LREIEGECERLRREREDLVGKYENELRDEKMGRV
jgi:hypothetical protein